MPAQDGQKLPSSIQLRLVLSSNSSRGYLLVPWLSRNHNDYFRQQPTIRLEAFSRRPWNIWHPTQESYPILAPSEWWSWMLQLTLGESYPRCADRTQTLVPRNLLIPNDFTVRHHTLSQVSHHCNWWLDVRYVRKSPSFANQAWQKLSLQPNETIFQENTNKKCMQIGAVKQFSLPWRKAIKSSFSSHKRISFQLNTTINLIQWWHATVLAFWWSMEMSRGLSEAYPLFESCTRKLLSTFQHL